MSNLLTIKGLCKSYVQNKHSQYVLRNIDFSVDKGTFSIIMGKSGSGKTTFLNMLGLLDHFDAGSYIFNGEEVSGMDENSRSVFRNKNIGFVFQQFYLIESLTVAQNIELPLLYHGGYKKKERINMVKESLSLVGLEDKFASFPHELSGGQQQRVSIARALVTNPNLIIADEPTGALDWETGLQIIDILAELNKKSKTVIMVTHDNDLKKYATDFFYLKNGTFDKENNL